MNETYSKFDVDRYDAALYTAPFWDSGVIVNESVFPLIGENGERVFKLAYPAKKILFVKSYTCETRYVEGADYALNGDGELFIPENSAIEMREYTYLHPKENPEGHPRDVFYPHRKITGNEPDRWEFWDESSLLSRQLISVTYVREDDGSIERPAAIGRYLPHTMAKLTSGEKLKAVVAGDSLTGGAHASARLDIPPFAPPFAPMTFDAIRLKFPKSDIDLTVSGVGGGTSETFLLHEPIEPKITDLCPDLVLICFGMNDSDDQIVGFTEERYRKNNLAMIEKIKTALPECEIILVSSIYGNPYTFIREKYESLALVLKDIAEEYAGRGVAFCDPQAIERQMMRRKAFADFMADNMVHPNDFGMRIIAQTICDALR